MHQPLLDGSHSAGRPHHHPDDFEFAALLVAAIAAIALLVTIGSYLYAGSESGRFDRCVSKYEQYFSERIPFPVQGAVIRCEQLRDDDNLP